MLVSSRPLKVGWIQALTLTSLAVMEALGDKLRSQKELGSNRNDTSDTHRYLVDCEGGCKQRELQYAP